jgi:CDP-2,3-bis-(O-geranylgeranyl)-sn-glycerol synthase
MAAWINYVISALYFIFPAYCANATPVILGGGLPIDGGKKLRDGRPIFGPQKTLRGLVSGLAVGILVGFVQKKVLLGFALSLGALIGDLIESFIKRRLNLAPGTSFPVADQIDFVIGALLFSLFVAPPPLHIALVALIITPPIHLTTNFVAYIVGLKKEPW